MKTVSAFFIALFLISSSFVVNAKAPQIIDRGLDGDTHYYSVGCPNGTRASVSVRFSTRGGVANPKPRILEICASPVNGEVLCRRAWTVHQAAEKGCQ